MYILAELNFCRREFFRQCLRLVLRRASLETWLVVMLVGVLGVIWSGRNILDFVSSLYWDGMYGCRSSMRGGAQGLCIMVASPDDFSASDAETFLCEYAKAFSVYRLF